MEPSGYKLTPFTLVLITAEIIYRAGGDDEFFNTPGRAVITGSVIGFVGAADRYLDRLFNRSRTDAHRPR